MTRRGADLCSAAAFGFLALVFLWEGRELRITTDQGVPGAGFFPLLLAVATALMAIALAALALRRRPGPVVEAREADLPTDATVLADQTGLESRPSVSADVTLLDDEQPASQTRTVLVFVLILASVLLMPVLGFVLAMLLLSCGITFGVERRHDPTSIASAVLLPVLIYGLFAVLLGVRLPEGLFA